MNNKALKSGLWYTVANFLMRSIGFFTTPIFTRLLTKSEFGLYNNYTSWLAIITIIATMNLESTLISARFDFEDDFDGYILSVLSLSTVVTLTWTFIFNAFGTFFVNFFGIDQIYINGMMMYLLLLPAVNMFQVRERFFYEYKKTVAISLAISIGTALLSVLLVINLENKLFGRIVGSILPTILFGIVIYILFIRKGKRIKASYWKYALPICLPYIPHLLSLSILNSMDRVMITRWCSAEDTAVYSLAYTCGSMVTILLVSMNNAFAPWLGEKLNSEAYLEIRSFAKKYIFVFAYLALGIIVVAPEVLYCLGGKAYADAKYVMAPISMGCVCQFLYTMFVNVEQFKKKTVGMAFASMIAALINYLLNTIFIPKIGYLAAAYTTLVGYLCLLLIHMWLVKRLKLSKVYDYKLVIFVVIIGIVVTAVISWLYSYNLSRYLLLVLYVIVGVTVVGKHREEICKIIIRRS